MVSFEARGTINLLVLSSPIPKPSHAHALRMQLISGSLQTCSLCEGCLRCAHTINECMHSFCKQCLRAYLDKKLSEKPPAPDCPRCGIKLPVFEPWIGYCFSHLWWCLAIVDLLHDISGACAWTGPCKSCLTRSFLTIRRRSNGRLRYAVFCFCYDFASAHALASQRSTYSHPYTAERQARRGI